MERTYWRKYVHNKFLLSNLLRSTRLRLDTYIIRDHTEIGFENVDWTNVGQDTDPMAVSYR
jgi:hypothetical protein